MFSLRQNTRSFPLLPPRANALIAAADARMQLLPVARDGLATSPAAHEQDLLFVLLPKPDRLTPTTRLRVDLGLADALPVCTRIDQVTLGTERASEKNRDAPFDPEENPHTATP